MRRKKMEAKILKVFLSPSPGQVKRIKVVFLPQATQEDIGVLFDLHYARKISIDKDDVNKLIESHGPSWKKNDYLRTFNFTLIRPIFHTWFALRMSSAISNIEEEGGE